jgi:hypothetical protein
MYSSKLPLKLGYVPPDAALWALVLLYALSLCRVIFTHFPWYHLSHISHIFKLKVTTYNVFKYNSPLDKVELKRRVYLSINYQA